MNAPFLFVPLPSVIEIIVYVSFVSSTLLVLVDVISAAKLPLEADSNTEEELNAIFSGTAPRASSIAEFKCDTNPAVEVS